MLAMYNDGAGERGMRVKSRVWECRLVEKREGKSRRIGDMEGIRFHGSDCGITIQSFYH